MTGQIYHYAETDRLLRLTPGTARRWIDGYELAGRQYPPVIRHELTGSAWVTWGEFVEARLLSEFRNRIVTLAPAGQGLMVYSPLRWK